METQEHTYKNMYFQSIYLSIYLYIYILGTEAKLGIFLYYNKRLNYKTLLISIFKIKP